MTDKAWSKRVIEAENDVAKAESEYLALKEQTKTAKEEFDGAVAFLRGVVQDHAQTSLNYEDDGE